MQRLRRWLFESRSALLTGAAFGFVLARLDGDKGLAVALFAALLGALYGVCVWLLARLFRTRHFGHVVASGLCGPLPFVVFFTRELPGEERGGLLVIGLAFGLCAGLLEWADEGTAG